MSAATEDGMTMTNEIQTEAATSLYRERGHAPGCGVMFRTDRACTCAVGEVERLRGELTRAADALALVEVAQGAHGLTFWSEGALPGRARAGLTLGDTEHTLASWCPTAADARRALAHRLIATALALLEER